MRQNINNSYFVIISQISQAVFIHYNCRSLTEHLVISSVIFHLIYQLDLSFLSLRIPFTLSHLQRILFFSSHYSLKPFKNKRSGYKSRLRTRCKVREKMGWSFNIFHLHGRRIPFLTYLYSFLAFHPYR